MIKLVIFDLDGVLIDACEIHRIALNSALKEVCNYEIPMNEHYSKYNGLPTKIKLKKLFENGIITKDKIEKIENLKQKKTLEFINKDIHKDKEKVDMMEKLKNKNIMISCYTNSIRNTAEVMLQNSGIFNFLDILITNEEVKNPKPDPEGYLKILDFFNLEPKNSLIVEDSEVGIEAAKASGCNYIPVKSPNEVNFELIEKFVI